jgi:hypothetical protein
MRVEWAILCYNFNMKSESIDYYASAWRNRLKDRENRERELLEYALAEAKRIADILKSEYRAREIYLFGSLAFSLKNLRRFTFSSDIDLAVKNLPPERYFYILSRINEKSKFNVDIIDLDHCPEWLKESIIKNGVLLDEIS